MAPPLEGDGPKGAAVAHVEAAAPASAKTVEELKQEGNVAFKKAQVLRRTTASKQYLSDAKAFYVQAIQKLGGEPTNEGTLALACTLHANLAAVFLLEEPPRWPEGKAAADIALAVDPKHVKALYRRAQAQLEDNREGLPEHQLQGALADLEAALAVEPGNDQIGREAQRIRRRLATIEAARKVPTPLEILARIPESLRDRGGDCFGLHGYVWGQTENIVHLFVPTRGARLKMADVVVEFRPRSFRVVLLGPGGAEKPMLELKGALHKLVRPDESSWQLEDGGLLLHVELAKRVGRGDDEEEAEGEQGLQEGEHWRCVWDGHPVTNAPSAQERRKIQTMAHAACRAEVEEPREEKKAAPKSAEAALQRLREMCPGVSVEWGDTSLDALR